MYFHTFVHELEDHKRNFDDAVKAYVKDRCPDTVQGMETALDNMKDAIIGLEEWLQEHKSE